MSLFIKQHTNRILVQHFTHCLYCVWFF